MSNPDFWEEARAASIRHDTPEALTARVSLQARQRELEYEEYDRTMGREYHLQDRNLGRITCSSIVTMQGRDLFLWVAADDENAIVREDPDGELSGRQAEARDLPANFTIVHVDTVNMGHTPTPDSYFWDVIDSSTEPYDPEDVEIVPAEPATPGMLTHRAVYGLLEGSIEPVRSL